MSLLNIAELQIYIAVITGFLLYQNPHIQLGAVNALCLFYQFTCLLKLVVFDLILVPEELKHLACINHSFGIGKGAFYKGCNQFVGFGHVGAQVGIQQGKRFGH